MNTLDYACSTLGNHEFNYGLSFMDKVLAGANFPFVCANLIRGTELAANPRDDKLYLKPYVILDRKIKDGSGAERRYRTAAPLTVQGTAVSAVRAYRAVRDTDGAVRDTAVEWTDRTTPFSPFAEPPGDATQAAPHRCRFASPELDLSGRGELQEVTLTFVGPAPALLDRAVWWHSNVEGPQQVTSAVRESAAVVLTIAGPCAPDPGSGEALPWIEVRLPTDAGTLDADALTAVFSDVTLTVRVEALPADSAYAGDAKLDTEKEFQPFGPVLNGEVGGS